MNLYFINKLNNVNPNTRILDLGLEWIELKSKTRNGVQDCALELYTARGAYYSATSQSWSSIQTAIFRLIIAASDVHYITDSASTDIFYNYLNNWCMYTNPKTFCDLKNK